MWSHFYIAFQNILQEIKGFSKQNPFSKNQLSNSRENKQMMKKRFRMEYYTKSNEFRLLFSLQKQLPKVFYKKSCS